MTLCSPWERNSNSSNSSSGNINSIAADAAAAAATAAVPHLSVLLARNGSGITENQYDLINMVRIIDDSAAVTPVSMNKNRYYL